MRVSIPEFAEKRQLFDYLLENKSQIIAQKKLAPIYADPIALSVGKVKDTDISHKTNQPVQEDVDRLRVKVVANTANYIDSHQDMLHPR